MNNTKPRLRVSKILYVLFILLVITPIGVLTMIRKTEAVFNQYPLRGSEGIHVKVLSSDRYKGSTLVIDTDSSFFSLRSFSIGKDSRPLHYFLEKNDSISKLPRSNILYLYKVDSDEVIEFEYDWLD